MSIVHDTNTAATTVHPAAKMFPEMTASEFDGLKADIREHGQREPIVFWRGQLIDGRHRHRACLELGIEPSECELDEDLDPFAYVVSHNLHRRHLTTSQRSIVAAKLVNTQHGGDRVSKTSGDALPATTIDKAAAMMKVSPASVERAREVVEKGCDGLVDAVNAGSVSISKAAEIARKVKAPGEQLRLARESKWVKPPRRKAQKPKPAVGVAPPQREPSTRQSDIERAKKLAAEFVTLRGELESLNRDSKGVSGNSDVEVLWCLVNRCSTFRAGVADIMERAEHAVGSLLAELVGRP